MRLTTAAASESNASWNPTTLPVHKPALQGAQAPAPRARTPEGTLISLVDPPFAQGIKTLEDELRERAEFDKFRAPNDAKTHAMVAAVDLILALDKHDEAKDANPIACQRAAAILFELGQSRLLCRLAQWNTSRRFEFNVGPNTRDAATLARIGASWPSEAAVSLSLMIELTSYAILDLRPFVQAPLTLSLDIRATGWDTSGAWYVIPQMVGHRSLETLSLTLNESSLAVLQSLCGVKAQAITIVAEASWQWVADPSVSKEPLAEGQWQNPFMKKPSFSEQEIACYHAAAAKLVRSSGARVLRLPQSYRDPAFCAHVLACRNDWDTVQFSAMEGNTVLACLQADRFSIRQLDLNDWVITDDTQMDSMLQWAAQLGVSTLIFNGPLHLAYLAEGLERHLLKSTHVFECIEAWCVVDKGDQDDEDFDEEIFQPLLKNPIVVTVRHNPLAIASGGLGIGPNQEVLDGVHRTQLNTMSALNALVSAGDRIAIAQREVEKRWTGAIETLGFSVSLETDVIKILAFLRDLRPPFVQPKGRCEPTFSDDLQGSMMALQWYGVDERLLKGVVAHCLRARPEMGPRMCQVLMSGGLPQRQLDAEEWARRGRRYAKTWLREDALHSHEEATRRGDDMKRYAGLKPDAIALTAPPPHPDPNASGPTLLTTASGVPEAGALAASALPSPALDPDPAPTMLSLVKPSSRHNLQRLKHRFKVRAAAFQPGRADWQATDIIRQLLRYEHFVPIFVANETIRRELVKQLLLDGQGPLLKHIIHHTPAPKGWVLTALNQAVVETIADLVPWPQDAQCTCVLVMGRGLDAEAGQKVKAFAAGVKPEQLKVIVPTVRHHNDESLVGIIQAHGGLALSLEPLPDEPVDVEATIAWLKKVEFVPLRELQLRNLVCDDERLIRAVLDLVKGSGVKTLRIFDGSPLLTQAVVHCRHWHVLGVQPKLATKEMFDLGKVSAQTLHIALTKPGDEDSLPHVDAIVTQCKGLESIEFQDFPVDVLWLAHWLDRHSFVRSVKTSLRERDAEDAICALKIFQRNKSLMHFDMLSSIANPALQQAIHQMVTGNRLRHPDLEAIGAGNGLGMRIGGVHMRDVGGRIVSMLDPRDVLALSMTTKGVYFAARRPWEAEVDRLAALLVIESPEKFKRDLVVQLSHLDPKHRTPAGPLPTAQTPASTMRERVEVMRSAGVPDLAIGEALRRSLRMGARSNRDHVEAMVVVGAYPAEVWLKDVMGFDVQPSIDRMETT